jgi:protein TonB
LSNHIYSLRAPISETAYGAARVFPAGGRAGFALVADRSVPRKAPPPKFTLFANTAVPAGAAPPEFALVADRRPIAANPWSRRALYAALVAAFLLHLAVLAPFMIRPAPSAPDDHQLGMEQGAPEHLNVSVISEADLKRLSSDPFRQEAPPSPTPAETPGPPPEPAPEPRETPAKEASAAESPTQAKTDDKKNLPFDPSSYIAMASEQFGSQLKQAVNRAEARHEQHTPRQGGNVKSFRPGATHQGKSDEWERKVIWALAGTKPMGNGKWGTVLVTFVVTDSGQVQGLTLLKSSGDNWLDQGALLAVKQARMPPPPPGLPVGDRAFNIEYISLPDH